MATSKVKKAYITYQRFINGIGDYEKKEVADTVRFSRCVDLRSSPRSFKLMPRTAKESGSYIVDLPKWPATDGTDTYIYGDTGHVYKRTSAPVYSDLKQIPASHGNGMSYFGEDGYLHYASDRVLGRYGPLNISGASPTFTDDFLGSEGGVPTNTHSADLEASSSQYYTRVDSAPLSITSNISMEAYIKPESLPTSGNEMVIMGKWNENTNLRSYKFSLKTTSSNFGDGSDGNLTISADTTQAPTDSACSGTIATNTLSATNASFAAGQEILIYQVQGTNAGTLQRTKIQGYTAGTITTVNPLAVTFSSSGTNKAQVIVLPQYADVTINSGKTWSAKAWNGTTGGIGPVFLCNGTLTKTGIISATGKGFRGASSPGVGAYLDGKTGESYGLSTYDVATISNNYGGGGGGINNPGSGSGGGAGGGGAYSTAGGGGSQGGATSYGGYGGAVYGGQDLIAGVFFGSGGGSGANSYTDTSHGGYGGIGGGIVYFAAATITGTGTIVSAGNPGEIADLGHAAGGGGGGAGGAVLIHTQTAAFGTNLITAPGGAAGYNTNGFALPGGAGGSGRIHINYSTSYTGTSTPTLYATQDTTLSNITGYSLNLSLSSNGTNSEILSKPFTTVELAKWSHVAVTWQSAISTAIFYVDGVSIGSVVGTYTGIADTTALFSIGASFDSATGAAEKFYDGKIDDVRLWNIVRAADDIKFDKDYELGGNEIGLVVYYKLNNAAVDSTANAYDLTAVNTPTYTTDVPFSSPTARVDLDQSLDTSGQTFTLETSIDESSSAKKQEFVPAKDPQKSIQVNIVAKGTGDWTLTVHDVLNRTVASKTVTNANLNTGDFEFIFSDVWRPILGATYHFHITSTVSDGTVVTTSAGNLNTADFHTYYQFLVTDTEWHPQTQFLNMLVTGNERYLATWDASSYNPHRLTFPSGYRVRALGFYNEYLAIGTMRGTNIYDTDEGRIFFWDGTSTTYNFSIPVPEGGINALFGSRGILHVFAGYQGDHLEYRGGADAQKVKQVPKIEKDKYIEIYPGAVNMYKRLIHYGVAGAGDSVNVQRGVYVWGAKNKLYDEALTFDYIVSGLIYDSSVKIGMVYPVGKKLLIGVQAGTSYYIDVVDPAADPYPAGTVEFFIEDYGKVWKEKDAQTVRADFLPLNTGESVAVKYKLDREDSWNTMTPVTTADKDKARLNIMGGRHKEIEMACDITTIPTNETAYSSILSPDTMADDASYGYNIWTNPDNAKTSNDTYATVSLSDSDSDYLKATNFGFSIPAGAVINGILVEIERKKSGTGNIKDAYVGLVKSDGTVGTTNKADTTTAWPTSDTYVSYGSSTDLWGETWDYTKINDVDFGVVLSATQYTYLQSATASVDHIKITVYYVVKNATSPEVLSVALEHSPLAEEEAF